MQANTEIRNAAKRAGIYLWQVADAYGTSEGNLCRKLRHEIPVEEKTRILDIIARLAQERQEAI